MPRMATAPLASSASSGRKMKSLRWTIPINKAGCISSLAGQRWPAWSMMCMATIGRQASARPNTHATATHCAVARTHKVMDAAPFQLEITTDAPAAFHAPSCSPLRVLVACEYSGAVRDAFRALGHDAMSCDLLPSETPGPHYQGDIRDVLNDGWDLMVAHPPCTYMANSGVSWLHKQPERWGQLDDAAQFFNLLWSAPIAKIAIENPVMHKYAKERINGVQQTQTIQPYQFGHKEQKATCLWLKGLPLLNPTNEVEGRENRIWKMPPSADRQKLRSKTFPGIAAAMAEQWGSYLLNKSAQ